MLMGLVLGSFTFPHGGGITIKWMQPAQRAAAVAAPLFFVLTLFSIFALFLPIPATEPFAKSEAKRVNPSNQ